MGVFVFARFDPSLPAPGLQVLKLPSFPVSSQPAFPDQDDLSHQISKNKKYLTNLFNSLY